MPRPPDLIPGRKCNPALLGKGFVASRMQIGRVGNLVGMVLLWVYTHPQLHSVPSTVSIVQDQVQRR